jgi:hypothetical protein
MRQDGVPIPFPLSSAPGAKPIEAAGRLINCAAEPLGDGGMVIRRQPGLSTLATTAQTGYRGGLLVNNLFFAAFSGRLRSITSAGVDTDIGALAGTLPVTMARNNLTPTAQVAIVTENGAFQTTAAAGAPVAWVDPDLPQPNSVCFQDGYFFFGIGDRRVFATDINAVTVNSLSFITAQAKSSDALVRVVAHKGLLFIFCTASCEIWNDTANPTPAFPYSRLQVIDRGLASLTAVAGWEDGFGKMLWVADDDGVYILNDALQPDKVSPPDLDRLIRAVTDKTTLKAGCYTFAGKSFWTISSPTWTWEFNLSTQKWNERLSFNGSLLSLWRGVGGNLAFGKWLMGDTQSGKLGYIDDTTFMEFGAAQLFRVESGLVADFPNRSRVARADFEFVAGVGQATGSDPIQTDPTVEVSWSDDGGTKWSNPLFRKLGRQSVGTHRVYVCNTGLSRAVGRRWRLDISDPVYAALLKGRQSINPSAH